MAKETNTPNEPQPGYVPEATYRYTRKPLRTVWVLGMAGLMLGAIVMFVVLAVWKSFLAGKLGWSLWQFVLFYAGLIPPLIMLLAGGTHCSAIDAHTRGLTVRTCYFFSFFVPWSDIVAIKDFSDLPSEPGSSVNLVKGPTFMHRGFMVESIREWRWPRGITLHSDAYGYADLVNAIESQLVHRGSL